MKLKQFRFALLALVTALAFCFFADPPAKAMSVGAVKTSVNKQIKIMDAPAVAAMPSDEKELSRAVVTKQTFTIQTNFRRDAIPIKELAGFRATEYTPRN